MADDSTAALTASRREPSGSRDARRLRRTGAIPGILYGGGEDPVAFSVDGRDLRHALAHGGAVIDLQLDSSAGTPVVLKELVRHPVSGAYTHIDLLRVRLDRPIQAPVTLELSGAEDAPGVREGGVLEQLLREVTVEALPTSIPDSIQHDISAMEIGDTLTLASVTAPAAVTILTDEETLVATLTPPRLRTADEEGEIETETEVVGEGEAAAADEAEEASGGDAE
jgi:large subunit ribosomal protein L25